MPWLQIEERLMAIGSKASIHRQRAFFGIKDCIGCSVRRAADDGTYLYA